jgi:hypothetical protein
MSTVKLAVLSKAAKNYIGEDAEGRKVYRDFLVNVLPDGYAFVFSTDPELLYWPTSDIMSYIRTKHMHSGELSYELWIVATLTEDGHTVWGLTFWTRADAKPTWRTSGTVYYMVALQETTDTEMPGPPAYIERLEHIPTPVQTVRYQSGGTFDMDIYGTLGDEDSDGIQPVDEYGRPVGVVHSVSWPGTLAKSGDITSPLVLQYAPGTGVGYMGFMPLFYTYMEQ